MNLHEECLLNYLRYPDDLANTTELLKLNNMILEQSFLVKNFKDLKYSKASFEN